MCTEKYDKGHFQLMNRLYMYIIFQKIIYLKYAFSHGSNVQMIRLPSRFIKVYIKVSELSFGC